MIIAGGCFSSIGRSTINRCRAGSGGEFCWRPSAPYWLHRRWPKRLTSFGRKRLIEVPACQGFPEAGRLTKLGQPSMSGISAPLLTLIEVGATTPCPSKRRSTKRRQSAVPRYTSVRGRSSLSARGGSTFRPYRGLHLGSFCEVTVPEEP
jgi:hypothetical protein